MVLGNRQEGNGTKRGGREERKAAQRGGRRRRKTENWSCKGGPGSSANGAWRAGADGGPVNNLMAVISSSTAPHGPKGAAGISLRR